MTRKLNNVKCSGQYVPSPGYNVLTKQETNWRKRQKNQLFFFRGTKYIHEILGEVKTNSNNTNNDLTNPLKLSFKTKLTSVLVDIISLKKCKASSETHICRWLVKLNLIYFEKKTIKMQTCKYLLKIRINQIQHKYTQVMKPTSND